MNMLSSATRKTERKLVQNWDLIMPSIWRHRIGDLRRIRINLNSPRKSQQLTSVYTKAKCTAGCCQATWAFSKLRPRKRKKKRFRLRKCALKNGYLVLVNWLVSIEARKNEHEWMDLNQIFGRIDLRSLKTVCKLIYLIKLQSWDIKDTLYFLYKNMFCKNIAPEICEMLRISFQE